MKTREIDRFLFEVSWEVCNQVGGIYTVLKTKPELRFNTDTKGIK